MLDSASFTRHTTVTRTLAQPSLSTARNNSLTGNPPSWKSIPRWRRRCSLRANAPALPSRRLEYQHCQASATHRRRTHGLVYIRTYVHTTSTGRLFHFSRNTEAPYWLDDSLGLGGVIAHSFGLLFPIFSSFGRVIWHTLTAQWLGRFGDESDLCGQRQKGGGVHHDETHACFITTIYLHHTMYWLYS